MASSMQRTCRLSDGSSMDVALLSYADRVLILVTQLGKVGHLIQATIPETSSLPPPPESVGEPLSEPPTAIQLTSLLGSAPDEHSRVLHSIYASHVATIIWTSPLEAIAPTPRRPVVVGIALKKLGYGSDETERYKEDREVFERSMRALQEMLART